MQQQGRTLSTARFCGVDVLPTENWGSTPAKRPTHRRCETAPVGRAPAKIKSLTDSVGNFDFEAALKCPVRHRVAAITRHQG
jgi:hypothetical protein